MRLRSSTPFGQISPRERQSLPDPLGVLHKRMAFKVKISSGRVALLAVQRKSVPLRNFLLYGTRLLIPGSLRKEMSNLLHEGRQGIGQCRQRANETVWWPDL
ncbi:unnamed protein product [Ixodes pacificus]